MRQSILFTKTRKDPPSDEISVNAKLLVQGGFVFKEMSGVYTLLPLGLRVFKKIENIIRQEMNMAGGQEIFMTVLQEKEVWEKTNRWSEKIVDNWFKTKLKNDKELGLGFSHEEAIARIMSQYISSYKDLPFYVYQIQTKFRNEARAKSGLMRMREFSMKDLYSFSKNKEEHDNFYEGMKSVYMNVFERLGMGDKTYITISSGGSFSKYSYEFQTLSKAGEDEIYIINEDKKIAINKDDFSEEVLKDFNIKIDQKKLVEKKSIEVGDIYSLGFKYSKAFNLTYKNEKGKDDFVYMGSYGMSPTRLLGSVVELNNDKNGIIWPKSIAPFGVHLVSLCRKNEDMDKADEIYNKLLDKGIEVLYDDRLDISAGEKFADADLIGIPKRYIISPKTLVKNSIEIKDRKSSDVKMIDINSL